MSVVVDDLSFNAKPSLGEVKALVPSFCSGSTTFFCYVILTLGFGVGAAVFFTVQELELAWLFLSLTILWLIYSIAPWLSCAGPKPPPLGSFEEKEGVGYALRQIIIIANPHAGAGVAAQLEDVVSVFNEAGIKVDIRLTEYAKHGEDMARTMDLESIDALVVAGGDGSMHDVVNGLMQRPDGQKIPLGILPLGTGNSLCASLGCTEVMAMVERIKSGKAAGMDLVKVTVEDQVVWSMNCLCLGLVGDVGVAAESLRCLGSKRYDATAVWCILKGQMNEYDISYLTAEGLESTISGPHVGLFVNLTQYFGKEMRVAPEALIDDGLFDIGLLRAGGRRGKLIKLLQLLPTGQHASDPLLHMLQAKKCTITMPSRGVGVIDGELMQHRGTIEIECVPRCIPLLAL